MPIACWTSASLGVACAHVVALNAAAKSGTANNRGSVRLGQAIAVTKFTTGNYTNINSEWGA